MRSLYSDSPLFRESFIPTLFDTLFKASLVLTLVLILLGFCLSPIHVYSESTIEIFKGCYFLTRDLSNLNLFYLLL